MQRVSRTQKYIIFLLIIFKLNLLQHNIETKKLIIDYTIKEVENDKKPAQGFGIFYEGRLVVFYDYETDLSDGWEDETIHNNPPQVREKALQMGANIIEYAFKNQ